MSVKGKIYGKYLKRAKYVVKGKKLKSPIATIQKREVVNKPKTEFEYIGEPIVNKANKTTSMVGAQASVASKPTSVGVNSSSVAAKTPQMVAKKGNDTSFSELGKKIVEGEDKTNNSKSDSKTLMFVIVSLAIIIVAGMVKVGSMVYSEMNPKTNVASTKEKEDKKNDLSNLFLGSSNDSDEEVIDEVEATAEPTEEPEKKDEDKKEEEDKTNEDKQVEILLTENDNTNNNNINNNINNNREDVVNPNNPLDYLNQIVPTLSPIKKPTTPTTPTKPPKPPITAGDNNNNNSGNYTEIGDVANACNIYHVTKSSVSASAVKNYKYSKYKIEGGKVKVPTSDLNGIWFYDDGSGIKVLRGYENGVSVYVNTASLYEKEDGEYVLKEKIYVLTDHYIELDDEYSKDRDAEKGQKRFLMDYDYDLYKI